jgi:outer membrane translocation and assembly module TamA
MVAFVDVGHVSLEGRSVYGKPIVVGVGGGVRWTLRWLVNGTLRADVAYGSATQKWRLHLGTGQSF